MPLYRIHLINSDFESVEEFDYPSLEDARKGAIIAATAIVSESAAQGEPTTAVELQLYCDGARVARHVVTLSVAQLIIGKHSGD